MLTRPPSTSRQGARERGQVIVMFAGGIVLFMLLLAVVIDVSWYWANTLRVQRAADAAALAGVVWLPSCPDASAGGSCVSDNAHDTALAEAKKNGYVDGTNGTAITTSVDPDNNRRLRVIVKSDVNTYFMRVIGITKIPASRNSKAEFVLPVPMGSPQNYYGVGQFLGTTKTPHTSTGTTTVDADTGWGVVPTAVPAGGQWTASSGTIQAAVASSNSVYAQTSTNGFAQQWSNFGLATGVAGSPIPSPAANQTLTILGIQVRLSNTFLSATCMNSNIKVDLSWNNGAAGSWSTAIATPNLTKTSATSTLPASGGDTSTLAWGAAHTWVVNSSTNDFADGKFLARLTATNGCGTSTTFKVDQLEVRVYYRMATTTTTTTYTYDENAGPTPINDPVATPATALTPQNFWGAIFTKGGVRQNGDYFAPATIGGSASGKYAPPPASGVYSTKDASPTYDSNGYDYTVDLTGSTGGQVRLYDPIFCATGANKTGGWYGAGDHWTTQGSSGNTAIAPVAVTYTLWNMGSNPYSSSDDTLVPGATLAYDPGGMTLGDFSGSVGNPTTNQADSTHNGIQNVGRPDAQDCSTDPAHNHWVTLASGLAGGMYRVNVETSSQAANATVGAENLFAIWVNGTGGKARVYGGGRMAGYTQVGAAPQSFYLAQIEAVHAGKTLEIKLFDPGDVGGDARLYIQSPDGNAYNYATFDWSADAGCKPGVSETNCSGTGQQYIQTAVGGKSSFDNSLITITIKLPNTYGSGGLTPPSVPGTDPASRAGWWKIYYDVTNANDTTTWQVNIRGNPVHLVVP